MTDTNAPTTYCCNHYPNRVLRKEDLAAELGGVCERTVDNLVKAGRLPQPCWLNSIPVWMLYDVHAFISAASAAATGAVPTDDGANKSGATQGKKKPDTAHKAGKYRV